LTFDPVTGQLNSAGVVFVDIGTVDPASPGEIVARSIQP
jgi:hypothetical protein